MTKYIVKNCPAYIINGHCALNGEWDSPFDEVPCKDRTDCPIKKVVDKCKAECDAAERQLDGISEEVLQQLPQLYFLRGCRNVAYQILQMFQAEEVE